MKTQKLTPSTNHTDYFNAFIEKLGAKFKPLQIFNFSLHSLTQDEVGCFKNAVSTHNCNYCLLLVTESVTSIDHEVQDFANSCYKQGTVTVICHHKKSIQDSIAANNRFFNTVITKGKLVYSHNGVLSMDQIPPYDPADNAVKAMKHYNHHFPLAEGFYIGAGECLSKWSQYNVAVFMLHQSVEQLCISLIRVNIAYRSEFHNLYRLLQLCTCFSNAPHNLFLETLEDKRLFHILAKSYTAARYKNEFLVAEKDANAIYDKVTDFFTLVSTSCESKIEEMKQECFKLEHCL